MLNALQASAERGDSVLRQRDPPVRSGQTQCPHSPVKSSLGRSAERSLAEGVLRLPPGFSRPYAGAMMERILKGTPSRGRIFVRSHIPLCASQALLDQASLRADIYAQALTVGTYLA